MVRALGTDGKTIAARSHCFDDALKGIDGRGSPSLPSPSAHPYDEGRQTGDKERAIPYKPISDYGLIGDMHSAAVVGLDGAIDWLCFPRFDSPSVFAAILDDERGGRFRLSPAEAYQAEQRYLPDTNILSTIFTTEGGQVEVQDLMPIKANARESDFEVLRIVRGTKGSVAMSCLFQPRLDYARGRTELRAAVGGVVAEKDEARLALASPVDLTIEADTARGDFSIEEGDKVVFELQWGTSEPPSTLGWRDRLEFTAQEWRDVASDIDYDGRWRDEVIRSVLTLHLLLYLPTGALVAAATTSLPEWIGGDRNWDYRFCWIRDAAFTLDVLHRLGHTGETAHFIDWLTTFYESRGVQLQPVYGVSYEEQLGELTLDHLEGYRQSKPVRIGNGAAEQLQMDIFGEVMIALATFHRAGGAITDDIWSTIEDFAETVIENWRRAGRGIWEVRGEQRHFVHSKVMCWLALDRALALAEALGKPVEFDRWRAVREEIREDIMEHGWNERLQSFVQYYGAEYTDASLLMMPMVGFLPAEDERMRSTVRRIREELTVNGLLRRYPAELTDDGFGSEEGVFTMCTFWLVGYLTFIGELDEAQALFERVLECGNHLGLFSEMIDPSTGEALGNFPQAFTHVSLIHTARNLDLALRRQEAPAPEEMRVGEAGAPGHAS
ncbi:MAG: glycoside hydrolase family 15 protein [Chloroflexi bacterium]|nr:glycoside hydrolase family 15 protein [Chloroflexota bacterium]